jgi:hypothetical protein
MSLDKTPKGKVKLFACGGGGINIGHLFEKHRGKDEAGFAQIDVTYIDTSRSNVKSDIKPGDLYLLEGLDGSGKLRAENHKVIAEHIRDILQKHQPGDVNVILSTAAGGSGSVIAPSLASELLDRQLPVIVIAVGSADTRLDAQNTLKTLKSYDAVAKLREAPVVMHYVQNSATLSRTEADRKVESLITSLCALYSRENRELDSQDLFNFLRFDRVTTFPVQLAALSLVEPSSDISELGNVISVATLIKDEETKAGFQTMPEYQCVGFLPQGIEPKVLAATPLHFVTSDGLFADVAGQLNKLLKDLDQTQAARIQKSSIVSDRDHQTATGLVL